jgi:hypothetical protein
MGVALVGSSGQKRESIISSMMVVFFGKGFVASIA